MEVFLYTRSIIDEDGEKTRDAKGPCFLMRRAQKGKRQTGASSVFRQGLALVHEIDAFRYVALTQ
jgi:hypothetical protein